MPAGVPHAILAAAWLLLVAVQAPAADTTTIAPDARQTATLARPRIGLVLLQMADQTTPGGLERYTLGGFHQLSGYQSGQLTGNDVLLMRMTWYRRLKEAPTLTRGFFIGGSLEVGNIGRP